MAAKSASYSRPVYVVDGARTPFIKARGRPGPFAAADLAVGAGRPLLARQKFAPEQLDEVICGNAMASADEANIARIAALRLGCGKAVPAFTVHRNCGSGMQALDSAAMNIAAGRSELVLAGGVEAMSHGPLLFSPAMVHWLADWNQAKSVGQRMKLLGQLRPPHFAPVIGLLRGLTDPVVGLNMGQTAEKVAHQFGISRQQMDEYAARSQRRLAHAQEQGWMDEVVPLYGPDGKVYDHDDGVRADSSAEKLAKLKPVFDRKFGKVTAGNSSQVTDGAAWLILASEEAVQKHDLPVLGRLVETEWAGLDPAVMGLGPVHAATPILKRRRWGLNDVDYWEINEAFAGQVLGCLEAWKDADYCREYLGKKDALGQLDEERLNVDGGAIGAGHPVGASGARIVLHLLKVLRRENARRGIATLCIGGGQGGAVLVESA
ncbi:acetyl-CoA C-acetyltransferase [Alkalilimnicola sp. S0819]|uniref:acetyl-CoA C-acetyltransferase n=1 Tax=Alkalilimnicola sp. S0819 TaxID=2613922 RepID=UPI0012625D4D|nr:acetyl-CoA C-acetyltransferase [Alkalilimnicola sp. S0819]KAB7623622.1 acetyl-CoA C-acetyltransferase [Alkalilimnicola sp. S0819]MPQ16746.1 acetyl-CoA C-acetyltransferase [Alkalilimnicola sp. S0819]